MKEWILFVSLISSSLLYAGLDKNVEEKLALFDQRIHKLEERYQAIGKRSAYERRGRLGISLHGKPMARRWLAPHLSDTFTINSYTLAENCFLGVAIEVFDKDQKLVHQEDGPINMRKVNKVRKVDYIKGESLAYKLTFDTKQDDFPDPHYPSSKDQKEAKDILEELMSACHARYQFFLKHQREEVPSRGELTVPRDKTLAGRLIRYFEDDPSQKAALLSGGRESFAARLHISQEASRPKDSIRVQYLIFMADESGLRLSEELIKRRALGVDVSVYIDALSPFLDLRDLKVRKNTRRMYHNLMASGIPVHGYRCGAHHRLIDEIRMSRKSESPVYNQRPHEKFWIVNGKKAILGGMNIGNDYFRLNKAGSGYWRDQDVLVVGKEIVQDMANIYDSNVEAYRASYLDPREDSCFNPYDPIEERVDYHEFKARKTKRYKLRRHRSSKRRAQAHARGAIKEIEADLASGRIHFDFVPLQAARVVHNRPKLKELYIEESYLDLIRNAKDEILISNAYLIPSDPIKKALRRAAKRGVSIYLLSNDYATNDIPPVAMLARYYYKELVDYNYGSTGKEGQSKAIKILEWTGTKPGSEQEQGMNHAKFMIVDRKIVFIGSYNLDPRSRNINSEVGIVFEDQGHKLAEQLADIYMTEDRTFTRQLSYREILSYRRPIGMVRAARLRRKGFKLYKRARQLGREKFFLNVALYNEATW